MEVLGVVFKSPAVWSAIVALLSLVARYLEVPTDITAALLALLVAILSAVGVGNVVTEVRRARDARAMRVARPFVE